MNIFFEIVGYTGTFLILISMMMSSLVRLRIVNIAGSLASLTYALLIGTYPVALLNFTLIIINASKLVIHLSKARTAKPAQRAQLAGNESKASEYHKE